MRSWGGVGSESFWKHVPKSAEELGEGLRGKFTQAKRLENEKAFSGRVLHTDKTAGTKPQYLRRTRSVEELQIVSISLNLVVGWGRSHGEGYHIVLKFVKLSAD